MSITDPEVLINLYDWLETVPFSRPKKNFARDFSDAILAAELIKYFFPNLVQMHNYPNSSSVEQKRINWSTLNQRVLRKLDFPLSTLTINHLACGAKRETTEYFLNTLREKIDALIKRKIEKLKNKDSSTNAEFAQRIDVSPLKSLEEDIKESSFSNGDHVTSRIPRNIEIGDPDRVSRESYEQKVQELLACDETIKVLKARIQRLEETLHLKDETIERLQQMLDKSKCSQQTCADKLPEKRFQRNKAK